MEYADVHAAIVEDCRKGSRKAQYELYSLYSKAMYNICLRMLRNQLDAEDVLQHSFVDVFTKLHTFRHQSTIGAWIKKIVINNCINFLKKRRLQFEELREWHTEVPEDDHQEIDELDVSHIKKAILQLPDGYRVVFNLYLMEGYDHAEIGEILGVSVATSKSQYSRARHKLRQILSEQPMRSDF